MLTLLDVYSPGRMTAEDARRYYAEKLEFMQARSDLRYVVLKPDAGSWTELRGHAIVEHVEAPADLEVATIERAMLAGQRLAELVALHRPDVIECGSSTLMPTLVQLAAARLEPRPALIGFSHGDLARAPRRRRDRALRFLAKQGFAGFDAVFCPSEHEARMLHARLVDRLYLTPTGVDAELFCATRRSPELVERLRAGVESRPIVWTDADATTIAPIYAELCQRSSHDPALVLAGPNDDARSRLAAARRHVHAPSFDAPLERGRWLASCDLGLMLDGGSACAEAMAAGRAIVASGAAGRGARAAGRGARATGRGARAAELVRESGCGRVVTGSAAALAEATLGLAAARERDDLGLRGRTFMVRFDWPSCFERMLSCTIEVLDHCRRGRRVPRGIHERMQPDLAQLANHCS